ncbi:MAG: JAB domain-containing protein [Clostridia bacterium]|nr:JAB domain-containing protein [Clostridia bacterium]
MESIHSGHRQRVRKRYLNNGLDAFSDHEVLELLLFYCIPYKNTNDTAHILLNRFGSLSAVLEADYDELVRINGIGETAASMLTLLPGIARRYLLDRDENQIVFDKTSKIGNYLVNHYIGATKEHVELLTFDASMHMTYHITLHEGSVNSSEINPEKIAEIVFARRACSFVLAHNHPGGSTEPSEDDIVITRSLRCAFEPFNIEMIEHFIISGGAYRGILNNAMQKY